MSLVKLGELQEIKLENTSSCIHEINPEVLENFRKLAGDLKKIAPKADDFLYFSAIIINSAEASAINDDGTAKLNLKGEPVKVGWDKSDGSWKWTTNDPNIRPYKNANGDIFPEEEIIKAYKKWKYKPLCVDHKSSSVDHVRGFIVDTYYDRPLKRVVALCALDKAGFPQLARQVATGVSNCVSMGTGVGRAICYDCGRSARIEADFCNHMRNKTTYGEINTELNPIELSIVMSGADPKATIKNVLAAANTMNTYLENKQQELQKIAEDFTANISFNNTSNDKGQVTNIQVNSSDLDSFRKDVDQAIVDFQKLQSSLTSEEKLSNDGNNQVSNQSSGSQAMDEGSPTDSGLSLQTPQAVRLASNSQELDPLAELHQVTAGIEAKLVQMKKSLDRLTTSKTQQEENMSGSDKINKQGYFQGAGGVNEPTPGQVKYPKDPLNEECRNHEDKQMNGQSPFPEVGPVDGMHPSPASADPSNELERKKLLARAEVEERAIKRNAVVELAKQALKEKQAYWQGGGGVNEPTPNKPKYPKDKLNEELRDYEDKQMVGQPPFPGVGPVDGLHPSPASADVKDELKRKELLSRAGLRARFVKAANADGTPNKDKSAWEVFLGDRLILTAAVEDLASGLTTYDDIATKEFGVQLIEKVKTKGAETVFKMIKKAQVPPPGAPAPEATPVADPPVEDAGKDGDPKANAMELADKAQDVVSDLKEAVTVLTGEKAEMGGTEPAPVGGLGGPAMADDSKVSSASFSSVALNTIRYDLNTSLTQAMKESIAELNNHQEELKMIVGMYNDGAINDQTKDLASSIIEESLTEAKTAVAEGVKLMTAFVKYARGTKAIVKRAEMEAELQALAEDETMSDKKEDSHSADGGDLMALINDTNADIDAVHDLMKHDDLDGLLEDKNHDLDGLVADDNDSIQVETPAEAAEVAAKVPDAHVMVGKTASYDTREGRAVLRAKLAADALGKQETGEVEDASKLKFSDMLDQAGKLTDGQTHLDTKPSDHLGYVEDLPEINKRMLEVAKMPPKVRKEAEIIQRMVSEGKLDPKDVDSLVAVGLDKEAVSYWKKYYGEVDGGSEFASELVKEHVKASLENELNTFKVKIARAYELATDMADRGLCHSDRTAIAAQVDEIMKFNDDSFDSLKRVVARYQPTLRKEASSLPQVGFRDDITSTASAVMVEDGFAQLSAQLGVKKGTF
jgi:hypothetical protein